MRAAKRSVKAYDLLKLSITNCWGQETDISTIFSSMTITESVFRMGTSGTLYIVDDLGLFEMLPFVGDEKINVSYRTEWMGEEDPIFERTFKINRIDNGKQYTGATRSYIIHFISVEIEHNQSTFVSKAYKGKTSDLIVSDIWKSLSDSDKLTCTTAKSAPRYIVPNLRPFDAINWLSIHSESVEGYSDYVLFEDRDGWHWSPIRELIQKDPVQTIHSSIAATTTLRAASRDNAESIKFLRLYDVMDMCKSGLYGVDEVQYSLINKKIAGEVSLYSDDTFVEQPRLTERRTEQCDMPLGYSVDRLRGNDPETVYGGSHKANMVRTQLMSEWKGNTWSVKLPGNTNQTCGKVIDLNLPSMSPGGSVTHKDSVYGGHYLITDINHIFTPLEYESEMTIRSNRMRVE